MIKKIKLHDDQTENKLNFTKICQLYFSDQSSFFGAFLKNAFMKIMNFKYKLK